MFIYFASEGSRIKIGSTSKSVEHRLKQISHSLPEPLKLIGFIEGPREYERAAQSMLVEFNLKGEWFRDTPEAHALIQSILAEPSTLDPLLPPDQGEGDFVSTEILPENRRRARDLVLNSMWPGSVLEQLTALSGAPPETVHGWLHDREPFPLLVRLALRALMTGYLMDDKVEDFTDPHALNE